VDPGVFHDGEDLQRQAVLVVRLWAEGELPDGLRARITSTLNLATGDEEVALTTGVDTILDTVRTWLAAYLES
jgi:hypothetical protein